MATSTGRAIRFNEAKVRPMGRNAAGVRGVTLTQAGDEVIGMICVEDIFSTILVVSEKGFGKRTFLNDPEDKEPVYRITNRGGKGVKTMNITDKTGKLLSIQNVRDEDDLMIITKSGVTIRMHIDTIRTMGRAAQGVKLINLKNNAEIAAIANVPRTEDEDDEAELLDALPISENSEELGVIEDMDDDIEEIETDDMNTNDSEEELEDEDDDE
jgi:DNA gyrase subunit A